MPVFPERLTAEIRSRLDYTAIFTEYFGEMRGSGAERSVRCIFHEDRTPSLSINLRDGVYCCHNPECGARGDVFDLVQRCGSMSFPDAVRHLATRVGIDVETFGLTQTFSPTPMEAIRAGVPRDLPPVETPPIDEALVESFRYLIEQNIAVRDRLCTRRGLTPDTLSTFQVGWDGTRYTIPVRDASGAVRNIRRYDPNAREARAKMLSWRTGYGEARLFNLAVLLDADDTRPVLICEGEMDCLLAVQCGFRAVTTTGGAGTWREGWNQHFTGRDVLICYDCDEAGRIGARRVARDLSPIAASVRVIDLGLTEPAGADFTDYIHGHGQTPADFRRLAESTPLFTTTDDTPPEPSASADDTDIDTLHLSLISQPEYHNQRVRTTAMVSGKDVTPSHFPSIFEARCGTPGLPHCAQCRLSGDGGSATPGRAAVEVPVNGNAPLTLVNISDGAKFKRMKALAGIPSKCEVVRFEATTPATMEKILLIPEIDRTTRGATYVTRPAYFIGHGLEANKTYTFTGYTVADPVTQQVTHVFTSAMETKSSLDQFTLTPSTVEALRIFQPAEDTLDALDATLDAIYVQLERVTRIYQRRDVMLAVDLIFHSQMSFALQGEMLARGWSEALIVGDTRTGKSTVVLRMVDYYQAGEVTSGENTSNSGLVAGLTQIGTTWALRWGKIPLNNRRLLVIDEAGNIPTEQIARMSSLRSSGIAEITKIHTERTDARVRGIWIANPRGNRPLATYSHGATAIKELIGAPEDIARFDVVVTAAAQDVALGVVNARRSHEAPERYSSTLCHQRVMWAWSRRPEDIVFEDGTDDAILAAANIHGERYRYASEIPLVEPNEQRVKIARLAVAAAGLFFSTNDTGSTVQVKPVHVAFAVRFLDSTYSKPSLGYTDYAEAARRRYTLTITPRLNDLMSGTGVARGFLDQERLAQRDIAELLGIDDRALLRETMSFLRDCGFLRSLGTSAYVKTAAAITFLRDILNTAQAPIASVRTAPETMPLISSAAASEDLPW